MVNFRKPIREIIAFVGPEGSGKDYSCQRLLMTKGFEKVAFADILRDVAFLTLGMDFAEGMENYEELKKTELFNGLTFRNILENLGSAIRKYDQDFWARGIFKAIESTHKNICISDLRYPNEYRVLKNYCEKNLINFKLVFTDYHSDRYKDNNPHESAQMSNYLKQLGYKDQELVDEVDIANFEFMKEAGEGEK